MRHGRCKIFSSSAGVAIMTCPANFIPVPAYPGRALRPLPAGPRGTAAAPAHRAQDRVCSAWRTRLVTHARTPRSRAPPSSTRFPPTSPVVVRAVHRQVLTTAPPSPHRYVTYGSRPSGSCPASRPYQTDKGCCGACRTDQGTVMAFDCGTTCSSSPRPGRFVHSRYLPHPAFFRVSPVQLSMA